MCNLLKLIKQTTDKDVKKFGTKAPKITLTTGFPVFDYFNGSIGVSTLKDALLYLGLNAGKSLMIAGPTSSGKSTFAYQVAYNLVKPYDNGIIEFLDYEGAFTPERFVQVNNGATMEWFDEHCDFKTGRISSETLLNYVLEIYNTKISHPEMMIENPNGTVDDAGKPVMMYPPTVIVIDSIAVMRPEKFADMDNATLAGATAAGRISQVHGEIFKRLIQPCLTANIILVSVNHLTAKMSPNGMPMAADIKGMSQEDHLPGGRSINYISDCLLIVKLGQQIMDAKKEPFYSIDGYEANFKMIKSRNSASNRGFTLFYNPVNGFISSISMVHTLKNNGRITGNRNGFRFSMFPDYKFNANDIETLYNTDAEFRNMLLKEYHDYGTNLIQVSNNVSSQFVTETENANAELDIEAVVAEAAHDLETSNTETVIDTTGL